MGRRESARRCPVGEAIRDYVSGGEGNASLTKDLR